MTPEQQKFIRDLILFPPEGIRRISKEEFLRKFPSALEKGVLALKLLDDAYRERNIDDLQCVMIIGNVFGFSDKHQNVLCLLLEEDWHISHEDIVSALGKLQMTPRTIDALYRITQWIPSYLDFDESRALAVKAIWVLGSVDSLEAEQKLKAIGNSSNLVLRQEAERQLNRRRANN